MKTPREQAEELLAGKVNHGLLPSSIKDIIRALCDESDKLEQAAVTLSIQVAHHKARREFAEQVLIDSKAREGRLIEENEVLREVHEAARQVFRYQGIDKERYQTAGIRLQDAVHAVIDNDEQALTQEEQSKRK